MVYNKIVCDGNTEEVFDVLFSQVEDSVLKEKAALTSKEKDDIFCKWLDLINQGYDFASSRPTFILFLLRELGRLPKIIERKSIYSTFGQEDRQPSQYHVAIKALVNGVLEKQSVEDDKLIDALNEVLRKALIRHYPLIDDISFITFEVASVKAQNNFGVKIKMKGQFSLRIKGKEKQWNIIAVGENLEETAWKVLAGGYHYGLVAFGDILPNKKEAVR